VGIFCCYASACRRCISLSSKNKQRIAELQSAEARLAANRIAAFIDYQEKKQLLARRQSRPGAAAC